MTQPFQFSNGQLAHSAEDLLQLCEQFPDDGTNYLVREDLEKWLAYIGKEDIAQCAANARQTAQSDRQKLEEFLTRCHTLSSPETTATIEEISEPTPEPKANTVAKTESEPIETETVPTSIATSKPAPATTTQSNATSPKPSFFRMIARLIVNVVYRNKS